MPTLHAAPSGTRVERYDAQAPRGGVVLVSEVFGIDEALRDYAARLAQEGWTVVLPDLWWRSGPPPAGGPEAVKDALARLADHEALADVAAARSFLPTGLPQFLMGFCVGGLYARMAACVLPGVAGVVEFYGRVVYPTLSPAKPTQPLDLLPGLRCPYQGHYGSLDPVAPAAHVAELERRLAARSVASQVFLYPGLGHAFMNPGRPTWEPEAACTAWGRALTFLEQVAG